MYQKLRQTLSVLSLLLFPLSYYYLSPALPLMGASKGLVTGSLVLFVFLFFFSFFAGRVFCSWLCPAGALQNLLIPIRNKRVSVKKISWIKYLIWIPWLIMVLAFFKKAGGVAEVDFFYQTEKGISTASFHAAVLYSIIVLTFFILSLAAGRRAGCHTLCWISPFMITGRKLGLLLKLPSLRLKTYPKKCNGCTRCDKVCPMSLPVSQLIKKGCITDSNCTLCCLCEEVCKTGVIKLGL